MKPDLKFIESICFHRGEYSLIKYHQSRVNETFQRFFPQAGAMRLSDILPKISDPGKHKVRVVYGINSVEIESSPYSPKAVRSLRVIRNDSIDYRYKYEDRSSLSGLYAQRQDADDVLIVKNGKVTDSSYANLAFRKNDQWFTPDTFLLNGVKRQFLIENKKLTPCAITIDDLPGFQSVGLINAMLQLGEIEIPITSIMY